MNCDGTDCKNFDRRGGHLSDDTENKEKTTDDKSRPENTVYPPRQMLNEVNTAIQSVLLGGQSYRIGSRSLTRADLSLLRSMRTELEAQIAAEDPSPFFQNTYVAIFDGR